MYYLRFLLIISLVNVFSGCKEKTAEPEAKSKPSLPEIKKKYPEKFKDSKTNKSRSSQPLKFPDSICGRIVKKIKECELEKTKKSKKLKEELKNSILSYKQRKFQENLDKYIKHCQGVTKDIPASKLDKCLSLNCVEMDKCLKKNYESKKSSGKNNQ
ncbi:MAG: hypothetical protein ACQES9_05895 [Myxococcota bacterium]